MTVAELIAQLQNMPQDAVVRIAVIDEAEKLHYGYRTAEGVSNVLGGVRIEQSEVKDA